MEVGAVEQKSFFSKMHNSTFCRYNSPKQCDSNAHECAYYASLATLHD